MPLKFYPPLSPHEQSIYLTLPKLNGSVVSPEYYPRERKAAGEREFLAWCEEHPRADWPQWLNDWHIKYHLVKGSARHQGVERAGIPAVPEGGN
jgi:transposase